jgi:hypothetical protein
MAIRGGNDHQKGQECHGHPGSEGTEVQIRPNAQGHKGSEEAQLDPPGGEQSEDHLRCSFLERWGTAG